VSEEEIRSEKYSKTKPRASNGVETSKSTGSILKYMNITCLVLTVIDILAFTANTKVVTENFEYIRSVLTGKNVFTNILPNIINGLAHLSIKL
jgi:hypothetical protein